ncbi:MAG: formyltetrahydrofolate deformylase [Candidatus Limnocylindria bacterium]
MMSERELILTLACPDQRGIVYAIARAIAEGGGNILDSQQFGDPDASVFFMRVHFADEAAGTLESWRQDLAPVAEAHAMRWELHDAAHRSRVLVAAPREGHCLNDLLYRAQSGALPTDIMGVVSMYRDFEPLATGYGVPYHLLPGGDGAAEERDDAILEIVRDQRIDLVVLARYMQILGPAACGFLTGRAVNIHHSFLPSFKGARPYAQAHASGVKLIGATAHYVTEQLDEGPIIEQEVARVDHAHSVAELARVGRDVECVALARAVRWHVEHRVLLHGDPTVVFR